jgi:hypothetical protein
VKLNNTSGDLDRLNEEKDQEILILQETLDASIRNLSEARQVSILIIKQHRF